LPLAVAAADSGSAVVAAVVVVTAGLVLAERPGFALQSLRCFAGQLAHFNNNSLNSMTTRSLQ